MRQEANMASEFIGVIRGAGSGMVYAIVNPDADAELDNPRLLLLRGTEAEPMEMIKVPREEYMKAGSMDEVAALVARYTL